MSIWCFDVQTRTSLKQKYTLLGYPPMFKLSPLHPQNAIDFNPLTRHVLAGAETETSSERRKKERRALCFSYFITVQCFQPNKVYF